MKKYSFYVIAALLGAGSVLSCDKEADYLPEDEQLVEEPDVVSPEGNGDAVIVFSATLNEAGETKTYITTPEDSGVNEGKYVPKWNSSDKIKVNGVQSAAGVRSADFTSASFSFSEEVTGPFYAIAPSADNRTWDAENTRYSIIVSGTGSPQVYRNYADGSSDARGTNPTYDMSHAVLAAYSETTSLQFQQLTTYFKLTFTKGAGVASGTKIKTIYVRQGEAADTPNIGGSWRVSFDGSGVASITPGSLTAIIAYNCLKNGGTDIEGVDFGSPVIITLPSYNFEHGLIITVKDTEGHFQSFGIPAASSNLAAKKGTLITKTLTYNPQSGTINSAEDWEAFAAAVNGASTDWDLYKWVGNGTVKLGADIETTALSRITGTFPYTFDGQGHTITRTKTTVPLFESVSGEIKNLTLDGSMDKTSGSTSMAPLTYTLEKGGKLTNITNETTINAGTVESGLSANCVLSGIVVTVNGGTLTSCVNNGAITANLSVNANRECRVGGVVADIKNLEEDVLLKNCLNTGHLTINPTTTANNYGVNGGALGGVVAFIQDASHTVELDNCDNDGTLDWTQVALASNSTNAILIRRAIGIGGILGVGAPITWSGAYYLAEPSGTNGYAISMKDCDNSGAINGKTIQWYGVTVAASMSQITGNALQANGKVCIGGIAGSLIGNNSKFVSVNNCTNTGNVTPYDLGTSGSSYGSNQAGFNAIVGGLVGWGGYLDIQNATAGGTLGTKARHAFSLGGVIGFAVRKFSISNTTVSATGYFVAGHNNDSDDNKFTAENYAYFVSVPVKLGNNNLTNVVPNINGSTISGCTVSGTISTLMKTFSTTSDRSTDSGWEAEASSSATNWVQGHGYTTLATDVTIN